MDLPDDPGDPTGPAPDSDAELPPCRDLDPETLGLLVRGAERMSLEAGDLVYTQGEPGNHLYLMLSGRLDRVDREPGPVIGRGDLVGVLEALSGEPRINTLAAIEDAELLRVPAASLDRLFQDQPEATAKLVEVAERRLLRWEMARLLPDVFGTLGPDVLAQMGMVFRWFRLSRGEQLFAQGDPGESLYLLVSGRLKVEVRTQAGTTRMIGEVAPGETVGEMALLTGEARSATVVALRDSVLQVCGREDFDALVRSHPQLYRHVSEILVRRLRSVILGSTPDQGRMSVAIVPLHEGVDLESFSRPFAEALDGFGSLLYLDRAGVQGRVGHFLTDKDAGLQDLRLLPWFEEQETRYDHVVYEAEARPSPWTTRCVRQADRIFLVANADHDPSVTDLEGRISTFLEGAHAPFHLVLLHPPDRATPRGTRRWLDPRDVHRHHHVRRGNVVDVERIARLLTGRGLGLVLSGGGARGFAQIAVLKVLEELGVAVDAIGGTSAGAGLGAQYAMGHTPDELRDINWREFAARKPFKAYTLPVFSLVSRDGLDRACRSIYRDLDITDLWIPYFCTTCDIQTGDKVLHFEGPLWKAARASTSLPGLAPPVNDGDRLLVDGGVLDNIPEEEMKDFCGGPVIAVDVTGGHHIPIDYDYEEMPSSWSVLWNRLNPFSRPVRVPGLLEIILRTATVSNTSQHALVDEVADLVLRPPVNDFGMLDFAAIDSVIEASMPYCRERLTEWVESAHREPTP